MKERPILFSASMVRAILDGSKTQTRRVVKSVLTLIEAKSSADWATALAGNDCYATEPTKEEIDQKAKNLHGRLFPFATKELGLIAFQCPYGQPGDQLWVRENWQVGDIWDGTKPSLLTPRHDILYPADGSYRSGKALAGMGKVRPSIFMPRWACRIQLEIVSVRVERLRDITEQDALAEGVVQEQVTPTVKRTAYSEFKNLWCSISGGDSWDVNPWIWVVEFKRVEGAA